MEQQLKTFDLNKGLNGSLMITRNGQSVIRVAYFPEAMPSQRIIALVKTESGCAIFTYYENGQMNEYAPHALDILMAPVKKEYWVASAVGVITTQIVTSFAKDTEQEALQYLAHNYSARDMQTHKITRLE